MIKVRKDPQPKEEPEYMSHDTYLFLRDLLEKEIEKCYDNFNTAHALIGTNFKFNRGGRYPDSRDFDPYGKDKRAVEQITENYRAYTRSIEQMKKDLRLAYAKAAHPNVIKNGMFKRERDSK